MNFNMEGTEGRNDLSVTEKRARNKEPGARTKPGNPNGYASSWRRYLAN
ncbi:MAG: hypothetical protein V4708_09180 [Bacteroidota bacterium]